MTEAMVGTEFSRHAEVERVGQWVRLLDNRLRVPGTKIGIGLDAIVGFLVPGLGDAITGALGIAVLIAAVRRGVPKIVVARMVVNLTIDLLFGLVPVVGDAFDVIWRSNVRNLALLERHQGELEPAARTSDYALVGVAGAIVTATVVAPLVGLYLLLTAAF